MSRRTTAALFVMCGVAIACAGQGTTEPSVVSVPSPPAVPDTVATTVSSSDPSLDSPATSVGGQRDPTPGSPIDPAGHETQASSATTTAAAPPTSPGGEPDSPAAEPTIAARPPTSLPVSSDRDVQVPGGLPVDVWYPTEPGPWPVAVVLHGGGWISGSKADMSGFARALAEGGVVVFNAGYSPLDRGGVFPQMFEEVTCAVVAAQQASPDYGGAGPVTVVGFSAGAHIGSVAAFSGGEFDTGCTSEAQPVGAFIGIAGPYDSDQFPFLALQFGGLLTEVPDAWTAGNPYTYVGADPDIGVLLLHGDNDVVVNPRFSDEFGSTLLSAGYEVDAQRYPRVGHFSIVRMDENGAPTVASALDFIWTRVLT